MHSVNLVTSWKMLQGEILASVVLLFYLESMKISYLEPLVRELVGVKFKCYSLLFCFHFIQKLIKSEESKLKKDIIHLNEQFCNLVIQASERYPEILNEDFAKRSARYTRKPKPTDAMHSSQILEFKSDGQHCVQNREDMKRSPSLPTVNGVRDKAKLLMCQHSPDTSDKLVPRIKTERMNRNGVCRSSAFRFSVQEIRESNDKLKSRRSESESVNFQLDKNEKDFIENEKRKKDSASKLEHSSSTTESSDSSTASMISQNHRCSPDNMDEKRKKKLKRRLLDARKSRDAVNLGIF